MVLLAAPLMLIAIFIIYILWQKNELAKFTANIYKINTSAENANEIWAKFVVLADLHNHEYGENNEKLLAKVDEISPDFIIVAGDMMIAKPGYDLNISMKLIEALSKKYKIYYGMGNHEYRLKLYQKQYVGMHEEFISKLKKNNVKLLDNKSETLEIKGKKLVISGLEIDRSYYKRFVNIKMDKDYINSLIGEKTNDYTILIAHNPEYFKTYAKWGADLTLSGHVHGGMVRVPFLGGVISPKIRIFPKYDSGLFDENGKKMLLSRGLGMHTIPVRINNRAELVVVELMKEG